MPPVVVALQSVCSVLAMGAGFVAIASILWGEAGVKPPICRLCGIAHWGVEHVWPKGTRDAMLREKISAAIKSSKSFTEVTATEALAIIRSDPDADGVIVIEKASPDPDTAGQIGPGKARRVDLGEARPEEPELIARLAAPIPVDVVGDTRQEFNPLPVFEPVGIVPTPVVEVVPAKASVEVVAGYTKQAEVERKKAQSREYMRAYRERKRKKS